jgi:hypothetical protein
VQKTSTELEPSSSNTNTTSALEESQLHFLSCRRKFDSLRRQELKHRSIPERRQSPCYSSIAKRMSHLEDVPGSRAYPAEKEPVSEHTALHNVKLHQELTPKRA